MALDEATRVDAATDFFGEEHVPRYAISMGVATILQARCLVALRASTYCLLSGCEF